MKKRRKTSSGDVGMGTVGPTLCVKGAMSMGVRVVLQLTDPRGGVKPATLGVIGGVRGEGVAKGVGGERVAKAVGDEEVSEEIGGEGGGECGWCS